MRKHFPGVYLLFLLLGGRPGEEMAIELYVVYNEAVYSPSIVFRWINTIRSADHGFESDKARR
jgi:hypothetical protein